jgi:hypothetical protein
MSVTLFPRRFEPILKRGIWTLFDNRIIFNTLQILSTLQMLPVVLLTVGLEAA